MHCADPFHVQHLSIIQELVIIHLKSNVRDIQKYQGAPEKEQYGGKIAWDLSTTLILNSFGNALVLL